MSIPVIRLEIEHMRHTMMVALSQYTARLDENLRQAVEAYCTPENLARIIDDETHRVLDHVIREEVKNWFIHGEGREIIKAAVEKKLKEGTTWTPLDPEWERF